MTFKEAFARARKEKGAGKTFTWNGKSYSTNYKEEPSAKSTRPKARPEGTAPTRPRARPERAGTPVAAVASGRARPRRPDQDNLAKTSPRPKDPTYARVRQAVRKSSEARTEARDAIIEAREEDITSTVKSLLNNTPTPGDVARRIPSFQDVGRRVRARVRRKRNY